MKKIKDSREFIGTKYGKLTILEVDDHVTKIENTNHRFCTCLCDCGNICYRDLYLIMRKGVNSCGCLHNEALQKIRQKRKNYKPKDENQTCKSCNKKPVYAKGYCRNCYERQKRNGFVTPSRSDIAELNKKFTNIKQEKPNKNHLLREEYAKLTPKTKTEKKYYNKFLNTDCSLREVAKSLNISVQCLSQTLKRMKDRESKSKTIH